MTALIPVAVVDDHLVFRREVVTALERDPTVEVVAEAADLQRLVPRLVTRPRVVLADASAPGRDAARALSRFAAASPSPVVVMLGPDDDAVRPLLAGAAGLVGKAQLLRTAAEVVHQVSAGLTVLGPEGGRALLRLSRQLDVTLTARQIELLEHLAAGRELVEWPAGPGEGAADANRCVAGAIMEVRAVAQRRPAVAAGAGPGSPAPSGQ